MSDVTVETLWLVKVGWMIPSQRSSDRVISAQPVSQRSPRESSHGKAQTVARSFPPVDDDLGSGTALGAGLRRAVRLLDVRDGLSGFQDGADDAQAGQGLPIR